MAEDFEIVVVNAVSGDERRLIGRTFVGSALDPPRVFLDDGMMLLVKRIVRDADGHPMRYELMLPPADVSGN